MRIRLLKKLLDTPTNLELIVEDISPLEAVRRNKAVAAQRKRDEAAQARLAQELRAQQDVERASEVPALVDDIFEVIAQYVALMRVEDYPEYTQASELKVCRPLTWKQKWLPGLFPPTYDSRAVWYLGYTSRPSLHIFMHVDIDGTPYMTTSEDTVPGFPRDVEMTRARLEALSYSDLVEVRDAVKRQYMVCLTLSKF